MQKASAPSTPEKADRACTALHGSAIWKSIWTPSAPGALELSSHWSKNMRCATWAFRTWATGSALAACTGITCRSSISLRQQSHSRPHGRMPAPLSARSCETGARCWSTAGAGSDAPALSRPFLATSWRMHPGVCRFISNAVYGGRLEPEAGTVRRTLVLDDSAQARVPAREPEGRELGRLIALSRQLAYGMIRVSNVAFISIIATTVRDVPTSGDRRRTP